MKKAPRRGRGDLSDFYDGRDENNLAEFPVALLGDTVPEGQNTIEFQDEVRDWKAGTLIVRRVCITGSDAFGLPTAKDEDVLLALIQLTKLANNFTSPEVWFTKHEVIEVLGWQNRGWAYDRVEESLHRWKGVSIHYRNAWRDNSRGRWCDSEAIGVIEYFKLVDSRYKAQRRETHDARSRFVWNKVLFESFQAGYLKKLDFRAYRRLHRPAARRAYRFLDKRFYHGPEWEFDLRQFACEKLGFSRAYDTGQLKERLRPALGELETIGFIEPVRYRKERAKVWKIAIAKKQDVRISAPQKQNSRTELEALLVSRGVSCDRARQLVEGFAESRICEKLGLFDWLVARSDKRVAQNAPGFLVAAIRGDYPLPRDFVRRPRGEIKGRQRQATGQATAGQEAGNRTGKGDREQEALDAWWESQSDGERAESVSQALQSAGRIKVETYQRLVEGRSPLVGEFKKQVAFAHAMRKATASNDAGRSCHSSHMNVQKRRESATIEP